MRLFPRRLNFLLISLILGFAFLYIPILSLIIYSFNESKLVTVWGGFSTKWYGELFVTVAVINNGVINDQAMAVFY